MYGDSKDKERKQELVDPLPQIEEDNLLHRPPDPKEEHANRNSVPDTGRSDIRRVDEVQVGPQQQEGGKGEVQRLHHGAVCRRETRELLLPMEQVPEGQVEETEPKVVDAGHHDPCHDQFPFDCGK